MKSPSFYTYLLLRLLVTLGVATACVFCLGKSLYYTAFFCGLLVLVLLLELFSHIKSYFSFYDKTITAILNNDFSSNFSTSEKHSGYGNLVKLYDVLKDKRHEKETQDIIYRSILNSMESAAIILYQNNNEWEVFFINDYFRRYFEVPSVTRWKYMEKHLPALFNLVESRNFQDIRTSVQIKTPDGESQAFMFQSARSVTFGKVYYTILLDSIQNVVAKREKDAWINLMKVISHELMNSVTPIRSLSQNLDELVQQPQLSTEDIADIRQSVGTMIQRSNHLQNFIDSYRKLAMLPSPEKKPVNLTLLIAQALKLMQPVFKEKDITIINNVKGDMTVMADELQIEQLFINLLTNSLYATEQTIEKEIIISSAEKNDRLFITISDSGHGIDKEIEDKIFLPFFTTRKQGSGIGLTLSKNIIEGHGGYLSYNGTENRTQFTICFIK